MGNKISNVISVLWSFLKNIFIKMFRFNGFSFKLIERFSPNTKMVYGECMSNVLLENAAFARPIITTNNPGCRETVDNDVSGFIYEDTI